MNEFFSGCLPIHCQWEKRETHTAEERVDKKRIIRHCNTYASLPFQHQILHIKMPTHDILNKAQKPCRLFLLITYHKQMDLIHVTAFVIARLIQRMASTMAWRFEIIGDLNR